MQQEGSKNEGRAPIDPVEGGRCKPISMSLGMLRRRTLAWWGISWAIVAHVYSYSVFGVISCIWQPRGNIDTFTVLLTSPCNYFGHIRTCSGLRPPKWQQVPRRVRRSQRFMMVSRQTRLHTGRLKGFGRLLFWSPGPVWWQLCFNQHCLTRKRRQQLHNVRRLSLKPFEVTGLEAYQPMPQRLPDVLQ